jgi:hypothetical protein
MPNDGVPHHNNTADSTWDVLPLNMVRMPRFQPLDGAIAKQPGCYRAGVAKPQAEFCIPKKRRCI